MKNKLTNSVNMINATTGFADANPTPTAGIPAFIIALGVVKGKVVLINGLNQIAGGTTKGVTTDTNLLRLVLTEIALKCAKGTLAYANSINNNTLKAKVNFSQRALDKFKKEDVDDVCEGIHDAANDNAAAVVNFGVAAADITDLQTAIDLYRAATQNPRNARITITQANHQAEAIVKDIVKNYFVGQMDKMVDTIKATQNGYWNGYKQAREIIDLGSTTAKVSGTVLDENDVPLKNVKFTILRTNTDVQVASVQSDVKGKFSASHLPSGDFDFKWELNGYKTVTETNVHIAAGKELRRKIVMNAAIIQEGDLNMGGIGNINLSSVGSGITKVTIEAVNSTMRFFGATTPTGGAGSTFLDVAAGQSVVKTANDFAAATGMNNTANGFLNVQNTGMVQGHWKIIFDLS